jgi:KipI family sensor histidine kinase inhibitor
MSESSINASNITINQVSENAVLIEWPQTICEQQHQIIMACDKQIKVALGNAFIESIASYASLIIYYSVNSYELSSNTVNSLTIEELVQGVVEQVNQNHSSLDDASTNDAKTKNLKTSIIEIPVYYGEDAGWDIKDVSQRTHLSIDEVVKQHTQTTYRAYALGFTPGFCYLGQLPKALQLARKESPRISVPSGAVAIAAQQTAVYPHSSPGGWHILGQTPQAMTTIDSNTNTFSPTVSVGQYVKFTAISRKQFMALGGNLQLEHH